MSKLKETLETHIVIVVLVASAAVGGAVEQLFLFGIDDQGRNGDPAGQRDRPVADCLGEVRAAAQPWNAIQIGFRISST